jgi:hypothetical protein
MDFKAAFAQSVNKDFLKLESTALGIPFRFETIERSHLPSQKSFCSLSDGILDS